MKGMVNSGANPLREKSYAFALNIIRISRSIAEREKEFILSKQLMRSGTSIGANIEEALQGISKKDFTAKMSIALKESFETHYWIRLLSDSNLISANEASMIKNACSELMKMLTSIVRTSKGNGAS